MALWSPMLATAQVDLISNMLDFSLSTPVTFIQLDSPVDQDYIINLPDIHDAQWVKQWTSDDLPVFCRAEHLIQKKSGIPFRFRLGSVDYVDQLEGK